MAIPTAELFTDSVSVNTAFDMRRLEYDIGIGYGDDVEQAKALILEAIRSVESVLYDPPPEALVVKLADSSVHIRARWWITPPRPGGARDVHRHVRLLLARAADGGGGDSAPFVPAIAITEGVALALASLGVLIYFIHHHLAASIQVTQLITVVSQDLLHAIARLFPDKLGCGASEPQDRHEGRLPGGFEREARPASATRSGYLQAIDSEGLMQLATEHDLILHVTPRPGHFVIQGSVLVTAWPEGRVDEQFAEKILDAFILGAECTLTQDVEFAVDRLVEVAVRALSPGVNDPFTAMTCVDRLGEALCQLAERVLPSPSRYDADGRLRAVAHPVTFKGVTDAAFNQIRQYGRGSAAVTIRLLEVIAGIAARASREEDRAALLQQGRMVKRGGDEAIPEERDRQDVEAWYRAVERMLGQR